MKKGQQRVFCNGCQRVTNNKTLAQISREFTPSEYEEMEISYAEGTWEILGCDGCEAVTFRQTWRTSEDINPESGELVPSVSVYPPRQTKATMDRIGLPWEWEDTVPDAIRRIFRETVDCFRRENHILCAVGVRALIEAISADKGITSGLVKNRKGELVRSKSLAGKIEGLAQEGYLTEEHKNTLHELRFLGNEAAHELLHPGEMALRLALEIVLHTLENLYYLPYKATHIERARGRGK